MDRPIEATDSSSLPKRSYASGHLMCRATAWGIMGFLACSYFAWVSFSHILRSEYDWPHDGWTATTYIVWIVLLVGLMFDTNCLRERLIFGVLVVNFVVGFGLTVWHAAPGTAVHQARIGTGALWGLAALISLTTTGRGHTVGEVRKL